MSSPFPPKILCEIALHLPLTEDVIALGLTSHAVHAALSTPAPRHVCYCKDGISTYGKMRTIRHNAWRIGSDGYESITSIARRYNFSKQPPRVAHLLQILNITTFATHGDLIQYHFRSSYTLIFVFCPSIHFEKTEYWSQRLSKVFPVLIAHHRMSPNFRVVVPRSFDVLLTKQKSYFRL
ncbi:hypothetical protein EI94DRAFT_1732965 [Lactarius quietus]|nr:hypothetical protein EI94DRAFT_1732965 [Lactarius quietus]